MANTAPHVDPELLGTLPPVLRAVVLALGFARARSFLMEHGGVNVTVPLYQSRTLGLDEQELARLRHHLARHMDATGRVWMPKADKLLQRVRDTQIRKDRYKLSINEQARRHNLSSRQITNIYGDDDDRQFNLF